MTHKPTLQSISSANKLASSNPHNIRLVSLDNLVSCLTGNCPRMVPRFANPNDVDTRYLAVSYKWQPSTAFPLHVASYMDDRAWVSQSAPEGVLWAVVELARARGVQFIWMDSLCVDQSCALDGTSTAMSREDRARFIPRMGEIFTLAEVVAGYADPTQDGGCTDWYDRLWILQEMVLAKELMIFRGRWTTLAEERVFWGMKATSEEPVLGLRILSELGAACLGVCNGRRNLSLAQIARLTAKRECFCPQDRVYGIFGLLPFKTMLIPDYKDSVDVVWRKLCQEATEHEDLSILLTRCREFKDGQNILLDTGVLPELAQGLEISWHSDLIQSDPDKWVFRHHVPVLKEKSDLLDLQWSMDSTDTATGSKRKHDDHSPAAEGDAKDKSPPPRSFLTMASPAHKRPFVQSESPVVSPMKGVEASPAVQTKSTRGPLFQSATASAADDDEDEAPASSPSKKPLPVPKPVAVKPSVPVFGSTATPPPPSFGGSAFGSSFATTKTSFASLAKPSPAPAATKPQKTAENEKNPFGSVAFGDAGRAQLFGAGFGSSAGFGAAPTTATSSAASVFGSGGGFSAFGGSSMSASKAKEDATVTPTNTKPASPTKLATPAASTPTDVAESLKAGTPSSPAKVTTFGGSLGGRATEQIGGGDSLKSNASVKAVSFSSSQPAFGSKATTAGLSFGSAVSSFSTASVASSASGSSSVNAFDALLKSTKKPTAATKKDEQAEEDAGSDDENAAEFEVPIEKKVDIPEVEVKTGEEDESNIIQARCKLYRMDDTNTWKERGVGNLRLNCDDAGNSARLVMRAEGVLRLILNVRVIPGMPCQIVQEKFLQFACPEEGATFTRFLVKTANGNVAERLFNEIQTFSGVSEKGDA
ncbi:hypothetical protein HDU98_005806 [Podochytrium sp. JEL0797]|nr:hypothetical protein HDU98_005806 [Podochytrium sp. JEL0797]